MNEKEKFPGREQSRPENCADNTKGKKKIGLWKYSQKAFVFIE